MLTGALLSLLTFMIIIFSYLIINTIKKRKNNISKRISNLDKNDEQYTPNKIKNREQKSFINKLEQDLIEAGIKIDVRIFILIIIGLSILLYSLTYAIFKKPIVSLGPLPFTLFFLPATFLDVKKNKNKDRFESELVIVLRRMSSVLKNGSVLQALEDVKDMESLSQQMKLVLNEIYHRYKYGESIENAFKIVANKTGSDQFKLCAISIDLNKELGADLSKSLSEISYNIQRNQLSEKESKSLMATTVMIGRVLSVMPFVIIGYMVWQNSDLYQSYLNNIVHQIIFMLLFAWMFLGVFIVDKFSKSK